MSNQLAEFGREEGRVGGEKANGIRYEIWRTQRYTGTHHGLIVSSHKLPPYKKWHSVSYTSLRSSLSTVFQMIDACIVCGRRSDYRFFRKIDNI